MKINRFAICLLILFIVAPEAGARRQGQDSSLLPAEDLEKKLLEHPEEVAYAFGLRKRAKRGDEKAKPTLKRLYEKIENPKTKRTIALALIHLGEKDDKYWKAVEGPAKARIESDMPMILAFDGNGKSIRGKFSDEFLAWCKKKNVQPETLTMDALYGAQDDVRMLAQTRDPRAIPLLMKGLDSPNHLVVLKSAEGLVKFQHKPAMEKIAAACARLPKESAAPVAEYLLYFKDPKARAEAAKFIPALDLDKKLVRIEKDGISKIYSADDN